LAGRVISPITIKPDHTPFHSPPDPDHPGVLGYGIMDDVRAPIGNVDEATSKPTRYGVCRPRAKRSLKNFFEHDYLEIIIPVSVLCAVEAP